MQDSLTQTKPQLQEPIRKTRSPRPGIPKYSRINKHIAILAAIRAKDNGVTWKDIYIQLGYTKENYYNLLDTMRVHPLIYVFGWRYEGVKLLEIFKAVDVPPNCPKPPKPPRLLRKKK